MDSVHVQYSENGENKSEMMATLTEKMLAYTRGDESPHTFVAIVINLPYQAAEVPLEYDPSFPGRRYVVNGGVTSAMAQLNEEILEYPDGRVNIAIGMIKV